MIPNYAIDAHADALTLKNGSLSASISALEALLMVCALTNLPIAHTDMHLTAGSSTYLDNFVGPDFLKCFKSESKQLCASGNPIPPIAAATTSLTWEFSSFRRCCEMERTTISETCYLPAPPCSIGNDVSSLKRSNTFSIVRVGSSANPVCTFCILKFYSIPPRDWESWPGTKRYFSTFLLSSWKSN